ncbi:hypothetical protein BgiBS90_018773, partial [Biomphalaria glabrata]
MGNKVDKMLSQLKEGVNSFVKEQLPVDSLVKKLRGQDCGCTNSGDGDAGDLSAVCVCVVGKSCGCDFQDEKRDGDCCDDLNGMYRVERKETNEVFVPVVPVISTFHKNSSHESLKTVSDSLPLMSSREITNTCPNNGRGRNNEFDFGSGIRENSIPGNCIQAIDLNCICNVLREQCPCHETQLQDLTLTEMCTSAHISESDLNGGELIPAKPDVVVDEHYKDASWTYLADEAEKDYALENMASCGPTTVSRHVHGKGPLTQCLTTTTLESTVIATTSISVTWLATLTSTNSPCVSWLASVTIVMRSKQRPRYHLKRRLANWKK